MAFDALLERAIERDRWVKVETRIQFVDSAQVDSVVVAQVFTADGALLIWAYPLVNALS